MEVKTVRDLVVLCCADPMQKIREIDRTVKVIKGLTSDEKPSLATIDRTRNPCATADLLRKPLQASAITPLVPTRVRDVNQLASRLEPCFAGGSSTLVIVGEDELIEGVMRLARGSGKHKASFREPRHLQLISRKCPFKKNAHHQLRFVK